MIKIAKNVETLHTHTHTHTHTGILNNKNKKESRDIFINVSNCGTKIRNKYSIETLTQIKLNAVGADASVRPQNKNDIKIFGKIKSNNLTSNFQRPTSNSAITLIALIITIIVLLILAGVTLNMVIGENGILEKANISKEETNKSQALEELRIKVLDIQTEKNGQATLKDIIEELLKFDEYSLFMPDNTKIENANQDFSNLDFIYVNYKGYKFKIDDKLVVELVGKIESSDENNYTQEIGAEEKFEYTGEYQEFEAKDSGYYKMECYGAKGGYSRINGSIGATGGNGGYTFGVIYLEKGEKLYVYVGGHGADAVVGKDAKGGYNGGGLGTWDHSDDEAAGAGGGATDIRLISGEWNNFESLKSRIMVAAGGRRFILGNFWRSRRKPRRIN